MSGQNDVFNWTGGNLVCILSGDRPANIVSPASATLSCEYPFAGCMSCQCPACVKVRLSVTLYVGSVVLLAKIGF